MRVSPTTLVVAALLWSHVSLADVGEFLNAHPSLQTLEWQTRMVAEGEPGAGACARNAGTQLWVEARTPQRLRCVVEASGTRCWSVTAGSINQPCKGLNAPQPAPAWVKELADLPARPEMLSLQTPARSVGPTELRPSACVVIGFNEWSHSWVRIKDRWYANPKSLPVMLDWSLDLSKLTSSDTVGVVFDDGGSGMGSGEGHSVLQVLSLSNQALTPVTTIDLGPWSWSKEAGQFWSVSRPSVTGHELTLTPGPHPKCLSSYCGPWKVTPRATERYRWSGTTFEPITAPSHPSPARTAPAPAGP